MARLVPWFVDVDPAEGELTPDLLQRRLASAPGKVSAAIPVAVMGRPLDLTAWRAFQDATGVRVVVDAAAGFDATRSAPVPVMVSLHATKALGIGEGGCVVGDRTTIEKIRQAGNFGLSESKEYFSDGLNCKLDEFGAARLLARLETIDHGMQQRKLFATKIHSLVKRYPELVTDFWNESCSWSLFPIKFRNSGSLLAFQEKISSFLVTRRYYRPAISQGYRGKMNYIMSVPLNNSIELADTVLCLPVYEKIEKSLEVTVFNVLEAAFNSFRVGN
jgi:dTDP-4-amino-4,6-dideoxygalactose transaminase